MLGLGHVEIYSHQPGPIVTHDSLQVRKCSEALHLSGRGIGTQTATWTVFVVWNLHEHMIGMSSWSACALPCVFLSYNIELRHENPWNIDLKWKEMNHYIIIHNFTRSLEIDLRLTADMTWGSFSQDIINLNRLSLLWNVDRTIEIYFVVHTTRLRDLITPIHS